MRPRFVIAAESIGRALPSLDRCRKLRPLAKTTHTAHPHFEALVDPSCFQAVSEGGLLIGSLFQRGCSGPVQLTPAAQDAAIVTRGESLIGQYWGAYLAVLPDKDQATLHIVRAPLGDLPCYWTRIDRSVILASDLTLLHAAVGGQFPIDRTALARHLGAEDLRHAETCLKGVHELPGGQRMSIGAGEPVFTEIWSPWLFTTAGRQIFDVADARQRVRGAALHSVQARGSQLGPVLLKLSGGLDSSIVAACLRAANIDFASLNLVTLDASGDERDHARAVASAVDVELIESVRDASQVDLERSAAFRLPRPTAHGFAQESARLAAAAAERTGSKALFDGGGGDNIFCSLQSARPAADCLLSADSEGSFWPCARTIAELAQASLAQVAWRAFLISRRRSPRFRWQLDLRFLSEAARHDAEGGADHRWLAAPPGALPGKAAHVALIAGTQSIAEGFDVEAPLPSCSPLISQPLVEACLAVPSWHWFDRGYNRAVARHAFAGRLPKRTLWRRSKGAPDCFIAELYEANRALIRDMLMEGVLRRMGLLDLEALSLTLQSDAPVEGHDFLRVMQLVDAEAWARAWS